MTTFNTKQEVLPNIMWIMDKVFMYTNFGIVSVIHKDFFIGSVSWKSDGGGDLTSFRKNVAELFHSFE
jgi:lysophosphatidylglycerol acyltransferase 1